MERLDFRLPEFLRLSWVSPEAEQLWAPRVNAIVAARTELDWASVSRGLRRAALLSVPAERWATEQARANAAGLSLVELSRRRVTTAAYAAAHEVAAPGQPFEHWAALCTPGDADTLRSAYDTANDDLLGQLLGYPACCRAFFERVWKEERHIDTTWAMALGTIPDGPAREREVGGPWQTSMMLRWLGVRAVSHLPCSFACEETVRVADTMLDLLRALGYDEPAAWLAELLDAPTRWSALHGAAEIHHPLLRLCVNTDATPTRYEVRRQAERRPEPSARGLNFPYGERPRPAPPVHPERWTDNGFADPDGMARAHAPIIRFCASVAAGTRGLILDAGCGDGTLVEAICAALPGSRAAGVERHLEVVARARARVSEGIVLGELEDPEPWWPSEPPSVVLLMPGRLLEPGDWRALRRKLREVPRLVVYAYDDWLRPDGLAGLCQRAGVRLEALGPSGTVGLGRL